MYHPYLLNGRLRIQLPLSPPLTHAHTLNLRGVLSVSKRVIVARYWHFVSLSLFFFLPLSFTLIISHRLSDQLFTYHHKNLLIAYLIYTLIVYVLALCATGTITYSTHHAFFGEPVKFFDSLKSLTFSFFPLASTAIIANVLIVVISLSFLMLIKTVLMLVHTLGFVIHYNSVYFMWFSAAILIAIVIYLYVKWSLAFVVVVVESKWGFAALMRSSYLVKGMRSVSLLVMLYFGVSGAIIVGICSLDMRYIIVMMLGSFFLMMFLLRITAANTVLYNYCKALHGELALEVGEGFVHEYMNLPSDDGC